MPFQAVPFLVWFDEYCRRSQEKILLYIQELFEFYWLTFQVFLHCSGIPFLFFYVCLAQSDQCLLSRASFLSHFVITLFQILLYASLMLCQHVIGQSLSPASSRNVSTKSWGTIIQLSCTILLTKKIYCKYSQGQKKVLFHCLYLVAEGVYVIKI